MAQFSGFSLRKVVVRWLSVILQDSPCSIKIYLTTILLSNLTFFSRFLQATIIMLKP